MILRKILVNALYQLMAITHQGVTVAPTLHTGARTQQGPTVGFPSVVLQVYSDSQQFVQLTVRPVEAEREFVTSQTGVCFLETVCSCQSIENIRK